MAAGAEHDELDAAAGDACGGERARRRHVGEFFQADVGNSPLANPGATDDPFVARVEQAGKIVMVEHRRRQAFAPAGHGRVDHNDAPSCFVRIAGCRYNPQPELCRAAPRRFLKMQTPAATGAPPARHLRDLVDYALILCLMVSSAVAAAAAAAPVPTDKASGDAGNS